MADAPRVIRLAIKHDRLGEWDITIQKIVTPEETYHEVGVEAESFAPALHPEDARSLAATIVMAADMADKLDAEFMDGGETP